MHRQFETAKQQYRDRLYSYAWYSLRSKADAEDVVQEAFLKLWEHMATVDPAQTGAWLMRVTQNLIVDQVRRRKARHNRTDADVDLDTIAQEDAQDERQDSQHQGTLKRIVEHSIAQLQDPYRTTVILRISVDHVKTDLFRVFVHDRSVDVSKISRADVGIYELKRPVDFAKFQAPQTNDRDCPQRQLILRIMEDDERMEMTVCIRNDRITGFTMFLLEPEEIMVINARGNIQALLSAVVRGNVNGKSRRRAARASATRPQDVPVTIAAGNGNSPPAS